MRWGEIIKKSWHITWRYRALWILGLFAGITGGSFGGGGSTGGGNNFSSLNSGSRSGTASSSAGSNPFSLIQAEHFLSQWLPVIIVVSALLIVIGFALSIIRIGARGGLVWAVNEIEEGRTPRIGEAWSVGFSRFWSLLGLSLMLIFPIAVAALLIVAGILIPLLGPLMRGATPNPAAVFVPMCGILAIGVPLLLVAGLVLGVMFITATRFVMLEGSGAVHAIGESWRALRARFADHTVMYLINAGLTLVSSLVLAIPIVLVVLVIAVPIAVAGASGQWGMLAAMAAVGFVILLVVTFAYSAIWGTFTSALWTIFYRRLTGREPLTADASPVPAAAYQAPLAPAVPGYAPVSPAPFGQPQAQPEPLQPAPPTYPAAPAPPMYAPAPPAPPTPAPPVSPATTEEPPPHE